MKVAWDLLGSSTLPVRDVDETMQIWVPRKGWVRPTGQRHGICKLQEVPVTKVRQWVRRRVRLLGTEDGFVMVMVKDPQEPACFGAFHGYPKHRKVQGGPGRQTSYVEVWHIGLMYCSVGDPNDFYYGASAKQVHPGLFDEV